MDRYHALYAAIRNTGDPNNELQTLLGENPDILEQAYLITAPDTCLHVAALAGSLSSVKEIIDRKPDWVNRLNNDGLNAIHIASANGNAEIVRVLLEKDAEQHRVRSSDGRIALHFAVLVGNVDVLRELVETRWPECEPDLWDGDESALHFALRNNQVEAFTQLLRMLKEKMDADELNRLLNSGDTDGNTLLHIATEKGQLPVLKLLLLQNVAANSYKVEVNALNGNQLTALDIYYNLGKQSLSGYVHNKVLKVLQGAGARRSQNLNVSVSVLSAPVPEQVNVCVYGAKLIYNFLVRIADSLNICNLWSAMIKELEGSPVETKNALMVVAVLIATVTYQAVLSPPGGFKQSTDNTGDSNGPPEIIGVKLHSNGMAVISSDPAIFAIVTVFGTIGFFSSMIIIFILTRGFPLKVLLWLALFAVCADFVCSLMYIAPVAFNIVYVAAMLMCAFIASQVMYLVGSRAYSCFFESVKGMHRGSTTPPSGGNVSV